MIMMTADRSRQERNRPHRCRRNRNKDTRNQQLLLGRLLGLRGAGLALAAVPDTPPLPRRSAPSAVFHSHLFCARLSVIHFRRETFDMHVLGRVIDSRVNAMLRGMVTR
jgi:hypothetical protein